ncbi:MAG: hypothetical protein ABJN65_11945 [Parasphingorhabdus sp.]
MASISEDFIQLAFSMDSFLGEGFYIDDVVANVEKPKVYTKSRDSLIDEIDNFLGLHSGNSGTQHDRLLHKYAKSMTPLIQLKKLENEGANLTEVYLPLVSSIYHCDISTFGGSHFENLKRKRTEFGAPKNSNELVAWRDSDRCSAEEFAEILNIRVQQYVEHAFAKFSGILFSHAEAKTIMSKLVISVIVDDTKDSWQAYCSYEPGFQGTIRINSSHSFRKSEVPLFLAHEGFPGHFFEATIKEWRVQNEQLPRAFALNLLHSPANLLAEGIAEFGIHSVGKLANEADWATFFDERYYADWRHNIAIRMILGEFEMEIAVEQLAEKTAQPVAKCRSSLDFAEKWLAYFPIYSMGYEKVSKLVMASETPNYEALYSLTDF